MDHCISMRYNCNTKYFRLRLSYEVSAENWWVVGNIKTGRMNKRTYIVSLSSWQSPIQSQNNYLLTSFTFLTRSKECAFLLQQQPNIIFQTLVFLLRSMCKGDVANELFQQLNLNSARLVPLNTVTEFEDATVATNLNFGRSK